MQFVILDIQVWSVRPDLLQSSIRLVCHAQNELLHLVKPQQFCYLYSHLLLLTFINRKVASIFPNSKLRIPKLSQALLEMQSRLPRDLETQRVYSRLISKEIDLYISNGKSFR
jgi:hypothetical protein